MVERWPMADQVLEVTYFADMIDFEVTNVE